MMRLQGRYEKSTHNGWQAWVPKKNKQLNYNAGKGERQMKVSNYEIKETVLALPKEKETDVYHKELNLISWYGGPDKLDIRGWSDDHEKMTKGISLTEDEFHKIAYAGLKRIGGIE